MGEYYRWVNVDKKQFMCPSDFDHGSKFWESSHKDSEILLALHTLLNDEWKNDHIIWFGDESSLSDNPSNYVVKVLEKDASDFGYPNDAFDTICESYINVAGLFKETEDEVRRQIGYYIDSYKKGINEINEYGIDIEHPFDNLFKKTGKRFKYVINHTKKVYYSLGETDILDIRDDRKLDWDADPITNLMSFGRRGGCGEWLGDIIGVADERPNGYEFLNKIRMEV